MNFKLRFSNCIILGFVIATGGKEVFLPHFRWGRCLITEQDVEGEQDAQGDDGVRGHRMMSRRMVNEITDQQSSSNRAQSRM